jgi:hypothetical protein
MTSRNQIAKTIVRAAFASSILCMSYAHGPSFAESGKGIAPAARNTTVVAPLLQTLVPQLKKSKVPVYLPTWLPPVKSLATTGKVYPRADMDNTSYSAVLSVRPGDAPGSATCFYINGGTDPLIKTDKKVDLGSGRAGYIEYGNLPSIAWAENSKSKFTYRLSFPGDDAELIRAAKSVVKVF